MIVCLIKLYLELVSSATISMHDRLLHPWLYKRKKITTTINSTNNYNYVNAK